MLFATLLWACGSLEGGAAPAGATICTFDGRLGLENLPLATGAATPVGYIYKPRGFGRCEGMEDTSFVIDDPAVAIAEGYDVRAVAPGQTTIHFSAKINGQPATVSHPLVVREAARREVWYDGKPITADLVTEPGKFVLVTVKFFDIEGNPVVGTGLPLEFDSRFQRMDALELTLTLDGTQPGRFPLPDSPWVVEVAGP